MPTLLNHLSCLFECNRSRISSRQKRTNSSRQYDWKQQTTRPTGFKQGHLLQIFCFVL